MQHRVVHSTGFVYDGRVVSSYNQARMTPVTSLSQSLLHHRIEVTPSPWVYSYTDYWGTHVTAFEVHEPHDALTVTSTSTVEVQRRPPEPDNLAWSALQEASVTDGLSEWLQVTERVEPGPELRDWITERAAAAPGPTELARRVTSRIHDEVSYVSGSTIVSSSAEEAWNLRSGVCQDMVHLAIGCLRVAGVPARYVSGYLHPSSDPAIGEAVAGESHAWVEWWDGTWVGFDPTNELEPGDRHMVVARGRDYGDVAPVTGIFSGGSAASMFVSVLVTRLR
jgi:transglutaminase-like putative cysteine protease